MNHTLCNETPLERLIRPTYNKLFQLKESCFAFRKVYMDYNETLRKDVPNAQTKLRKRTSRAHHAALDLLRSRLQADRTPPVVLKPKSLTRTLGFPFIERTCDEPDFR